MVRCGLWRLLMFCGGLERPLIAVAMRRGHPSFTGGQAGKIPRSWISLSLPVDGARLDAIPEDAAPGLFPPLVKRRPNKNIHLWYESVFFRDKGCCADSVLPTALKIFHVLPLFRHTATICDRGAANEGISADPGLLARPFEPVRPFASPMTARMRDQRRRACFAFEPTLDHFAAGSQSVALQRATCDAGGVKHSHNAMGGRGT